MDNMQFGYMLGKGTTVFAVFVARQLCEKYRTKRKKVCFGFDLERQI